MFIFILLLKLFSTVYSNHQICDKYNIINYSNLPYDLKEAILTVKRDDIMKNADSMTKDQLLKTLIRVIVRNESLWNAMIHDSRKYKFWNRSETLEDSYEFPCHVWSSTNQTKPQTVHQLTPFDIGLVGAIGDSLTAGNGALANTVIGTLIQYRGVSFSGGGQEQFSSVPTFANILRQYNPRLRGYAVGSGLPTSNQAKLNQAITGSYSESLKEQAVALVHRMSQDEHFDMDWKIITLFIGGNDICDYCFNRSRFSATNYRENVRQALDLLQARVPRALVAVINQIDMHLLSKCTVGLICPLVHYFVCQCAAFPRQESELLLKIKEFQEELSNLIASPRYSTRDDFAVVELPFFKNSPPIKYDPSTGQPDMTFMAPDCFHLSFQGHVLAARALWNSLLEPNDMKRNTFRPDIPMLCPSPQQPFMKTRKNSWPKNNEIFTF